MSGEVQVKVNVVHEDVYTPLGRGRIVYHLKDGSFVVEFEHGGGHIFRPEELMRVITRRKTSRYGQKQPANAGS